MGLDQSLYKEKYVPGWIEKDKLKVSVERGDKEVLVENGLDGVSVKWQVAYWRKCNQIHKWFVDNCGEGEDNCRAYPVDIEQLRELLKLCEKVKKSCKLVDHGEIESHEFKDGKIIKKNVPYKIIEDSSVAEELLPTESGFFFGSTDYDEYYMDDIDLTIKQLTEIIKEYDADTDKAYTDFWYQASW